MNNQKVAIVTGGGTGIGYGIAKKFIEKGMITYIIGRRLEKLEKAQKELGNLCKIVQFDLNELDKIPEMVNSIKESEGQIDVLVNNAGINYKCHMLELSDEKFQQVINTNLTAIFSLSKEVAKVMKEKSKGSIINITSMTSHYGIPKVVAYTASKAGLLASG